MDREINESDGSSSRHGTESDPVGLSIYPFIAPGVAVASGSRVGEKYVVKKRCARAFNLVSVLDFLCLNVK